MHAADRGSRRNVRALWYIGPNGDLVNPEPLVPRDLYEDIIARAARYGFRIHAEGSGRAAIGMVLSALGRADREAPIATSRHVLEHCIFPTREQIAECKRLGIIPMTCSNFVHGKASEVFIPRLGWDYAQDAVPLRWWLDAGVPVCQETDLGPRSAMFSVWSAVARQDGLTGEVLGPHQRITREEALRIFTVNPAYALGMEDKLGSLAPNKLADLAVISGDVLGCEQDELKDLEIAATMVAGEFVHDPHELG